MSNIADLHLWHCACQPANHTDKWASVDPACSLARAQQRTEQVGKRYRRRLQAETIAHNAETMPLLRETIRRVQALEEALVKVASKAGLSSATTSFTVPTRTFLNTLPKNEVGP